MDPKKKTPYEVFYNPARLVVPLFQRPYTWRRAEQWEPLWDDLVHLVEVRRTLKPSATHFFGAIVIQQVSTELGELPTWTVIDGQQRLTTLQLLLDAFHAQLVSHGWVDLATQVELLVVNPTAFLTQVKSSQEQRFKLWPTTKDRASFAEVMSATPPIDYSSIGESKLAEAHRFFAESIASWLDDAPDSRIAAGDLAAALTQGLELVSIGLDVGEDAQAIFETLNARGVPLSSADLIKNFVFQRVEGSEDEKEHAYTQWWAQFETPWWETEVQSGRVKYSRASLFLWHWLRARMLDDFPMRGLFAQFRLYVETSGTQVGRLLPELHAAALKYRSIVEGAEKPTGELTPAELFSYRVGILDSEVVRPLLIWLDEPEQSDLTDSDRTRIFQLLESWFVRRALVKAPSQGVNRFMVDLLRHLARQPHKDLAGSVEAFLVANHTSVGYWPGDDEVRDALRGATTYWKYLRARLRMVLEALEDELRGYPNGSKLAMGPIVRGKGTVEHLMPQNWSKHWPAELGPDQIAERDRTVQELGNLTLVTQALNSTVSNGSWASKRAYFQTVNDVLLTNEAVVNNDEWDERGIKRRTDTLIERILTVWPAPADHIGLSGRAAPVPADLSVDVAQLVDAGWIQPGAVLAARPAAHQATTAAVAQDGRIFVDETPYATPSAAGAAVAGVTTGINGWTFWALKATGATLAEVRAAYLESLGEVGLEDEEAGD